MAAVIGTALILVHPGRGRWADERDKGAGQLAVVLPSTDADARALEPIMVTLSLA